MQGHIWLGARVIAVGLALGGFGVGCVFDEPADARSGFGATSGPLMISGGDCACRMGDARGQSHPLRLVAKRSNECSLAANHNIPNKRVRNCGMRAITAESALAYTLFVMLWNAAWLNGSAEE